MAEDPVPRSSRIAVARSLVTEVFWAIVSVQKSVLQQTHPAFGRVFRANPELSSRIDGLWDEDDTCFDELIVLAHHAGVLAGTPSGSELIEAVSDACDHDFSPIALASETEDRRRVILDRLDRLRSDRGLRDEYVAILGEVYSALEGEWARVASATDAELRRVERLIASDRSLRDLMPDQAAAIIDLAPELAGTPGRDWLIAVTAFAGRCALLDLPGLIWCSFGESDRTEDRARAAELGRQLKTIADPTRLAIVRLLSVSSLRIGELASALAVSQPTVSNHVKVLREGGVVRSESRDGGQKLVVDREAISRLLGDVGELIGAAPRPGQRA